jgi:sulfate transport system permease protein
MVDALLLTQANSYTAIIVLALPLGLIEALATASLDAIPPRLVPDDQLVTANALLGGAQDVAIVVGPLAAAAVNLVFGSLIVWAITRYRFPGRRVLDALIDIPFALPTAVAGIALTNLYAENGWLGALLAPLGIKVSFTPLGIFVALIFIGLPFVVRTVQPVLEDLDKELEEVAATLGASRWTTVRRVVLPTIFPALLTGFALAFARAVGEYGSVIFIAGNLPNVSEIAPLLIVIRLEEFRYADATAIASVMLVASFIFLFIINWLQRWSEQRVGRH